MDIDGYSEHELLSLERKSSLVEEFTIEGLYGYRTIGLSANYSTTVLIARNGAGKTTLLAALDAFLRGQFLRLAEIQFSRITCKLRDCDPLILLQEDVASLLKLSEDSEIYLRAKQFGTPPRALREFLEIDYPNVAHSVRLLHENEIFNKIMASMGYSMPAARRLVEELRQTALQKNERISQLQDAISKAVGSVEIVYLPTYRRIELPLADNPSEERATGRRRPSVQSRLGLSRNGLFNADIQFGLSDISDRLSELNQEILLNSNQGYREISANIINELLDGTFERATLYENEKPDKDSLSLFFSRIREGRRTIPFRDISIPNLDQVYDGGASSPQSKQFLDYFLSKLNTVIEATRGIESLVEEFISNCNRYLSSGDDSADLFDNEDLLGTNSSLDDKLLTLDRKSLRVLVHSVAANRRIPMDSLSSGEKQMISLFARLYLYPGEKLFLIDEPELSLSIDWQRKILMDIAMAPTCRQVIAITHSPFVFDNALERFARSISVSIEPRTDAHMSTEEDEADE